MTICRAFIFWFASTILGLNITGATGGKKFFIHVDIESKINKFFAFVFLRFSDQATAVPSDWQKHPDKRAWQGPDAHKILSW